MARKRKPAEESFQMAPMIDMVFLLLVFFMTVSTLAKEGRPEVELPQSTTAEVPAEAPVREIITVKMDAGERRLFLFNREMDLTRLEAALKQSAEHARPAILLRAEPGFPWKEWAGIFEVIRSHGIGEVTFSTFEE